LGQSRPNVSPQATRVISHSTIWTGGFTTQPNWSKVNSHISKWSFLDTSTTQSRWKPYWASLESIRWKEESSVVFNELPLVTKTVGVTVEDGGILRCVGILWPVPVWGVAFVAALVAESLFVGVEEPSVPGKEIASVMDAEGLLDVRYDEVVELVKNISLNSATFV
jgi:hypothetical protein